jgi:hypothetical protein
MLQEVVFQVPLLRERPMLGTSCCATSAEAAITQEFWMLGGVDDSAVDTDHGRVWVRYDSAAVSEATLAAALAEIGYPTT